MNGFPHGPKFTWSDHAQEIVSGALPVTDSDIPVLLDWLQDRNWPGSGLISDYLPSLGSSLSGHLLRVVTSGDTIWIRWILEALADAYDAEFWRPIQEHLERLAFGKDSEGAHTAALYILARNRLISRDEVKSAISTMKELSNPEDADLWKLEKLLVELSGQNLSGAGECSL